MASQSWERAAHSVFCIFSFYYVFFSFWLFPISVSSVELVLIATVLGHSLPIAFLHDDAAIFN